MASNSPLSKPLLTVVDEIQNQNLADYQDLIYETDFWTPLIPIKTKSFEKVEPKKFCFEIVKYLK